MGRPCIRARASVGVPYQFDVNSNGALAPPPATGQGPVAPGGTVYGPAGVPYTTFARAGYVAPSGGGPQSSIFGNKDLSLMAGQVQGGEFVFP